MVLCCYLFVVLLFVSLVCLVVCFGIAAGFVVYIALFACGCCLDMLLWLAVTAVVMDV